MPVAPVCAMPTPLRSTSARTLARAAALSRVVLHEELLPRSLPRAARHSSARHESDMIAAQIDTPLQQRVHAAPARARIRNGPSDDERAAVAALDLARRAARLGGICGRCAKPLQPRTAVWWNWRRFALRFRTATELVPLCRLCTPVSSRTSTMPCLTCQRPVGRAPLKSRPLWRIRLRKRKTFCCERCRWAYAHRSRTTKRANARAAKTCGRCGRALDARRSDREWCSDRCRQAAYRARKNAAADRRERERLPAGGSQEGVSQHVGSRYE